MIHFLLEITKFTETRFPTPARKALLDDDEHDISISINDLLYKLACYVELGNDYNTARTMTMTPTFRQQKGFCRR